MIIVSENPLDPGKLFDELRKDHAGSVIFHYAVVKEQAGGRQTSGIRFERGGDIESELSEIEADIRSRGNIDDVLIARRMGLLKTGDLISLVAVSSSASVDAFEACRYGLDRIRKITAIKKTELYLD